MSGSAGDHSGPRAATVPVSSVWRRAPTPRQLAALALWGVREVLFGGAAGGGKSDFLLFAATQFADDPGSHALIIRRTYPELVAEDGIMRRAQEIWPEREWWRVSERRVAFPSGATAEFGHLSDSLAHLRHAGAAYTCICIDEAGSIPWEQIDFLGSRLRRPEGSSVPLMLRLASNPIGTSAPDLRERFVEPPPSARRAYVPARLDDNPHIDREAYREQLSSRDPVTRAQLLHGDWDIRPSAGFFIGLDSCPPLDPIPGPSVRAWDLAATRGAGDWTVGVRADADASGIGVSDIVRGRWGVGERDGVMRETARRDGPGVLIAVEREGGASGVAEARRLVGDVLSGYTARVIRPTGNKRVRALPLSAAISAGGVAVAPDAPWRREWVDELSVFGSRYSAHDDQVDATAMAHGVLTRLLREPRRGFAAL